VILRWSDPLLSGFSHSNVAVRYATNSFPDTLTDGSALYQGPLRTFTHTNCIPGQTYYYTIWCTHDGNLFLVPNP
jgi:hypothetical protein